MRDFVRAPGTALLIMVAAACGHDATPIGPTTPTPTAAAPAPSPAPSPAPAPTPAPTSAVTLNDDFSARLLFPADNWWNQDISGAPIDAQSDAFINYIGRTRALHADFGPAPFGIPYVGVGGSETRVPVTFVDYGDESDAGFGAERGYPIPEAAKTQPNFIEGARPGGGNDGDRHLLLVDRDRWLLYELFAARWTGQRWEAGSGAVFDLATSGRRPEGWTSADAAGLAILPGLVRYDEAQRGPIRHALRVTQHQRTTEAPVGNHDGLDRSQLRTGRWRRHDHESIGFDPAVRP